MADQTNPTNDPVAEYYASQAAFTASRTAQVERSAVAKILKQAKLKKSNITTFAGLEQAGFPIHLVVALQRMRLSSVVSDLMQRPTRSVLYSAFTDAIQGVPSATGNFGILVPWRNSFWVFHDCDLVGTLGDSGFYVKIEDRHFFFEKLTSLVSRFGLAEEW